MLCFVSSCAQYIVLVDALGADCRVLGEGEIDGLNSIVRRAKFGDLMVAVLGKMPAANLGSPFHSHAT